MLIVISIIIGVVLAVVSYNAYLNLQREYFSKCCEVKKLIRENESLDYKIEQLHGYIEYIKSNPEKRFYF